MSEHYILEQRTIIELSGKDCRTFLQGLITNDIEKLTPKSALFCALLTPQGKYLFDLFLVDTGDTILVDCVAEQAGALMKKLKIYKLRADVTIELLSGTYTVLAYLQPSASEFPGIDLDRVGSTAAWRGGYAYTDPRSSKLGLRCVATKIAMEDIEEKGNFFTYREALVRAAVSYGTEDMTPDKSIVLEHRFDEQNAMDWEKGCYVGQELMARTKHRGLLRKSLTPVEIESGTAENGERITYDGKRAGVMCSSIRTMDGKDIGLALLMHDHTDSYWQNPEGIKFECENGALLTPLKIQE